ncbi:MAG TPA: TOBE domain-containing protein, partial [Planctomycetota bacterium]|nr:TOBE domain-containing protein [Planctomycetota bacterium]
NVLALTVVEHVGGDGVTRARLGGVELVVPTSEAAAGERVFFGLAASEVLVAIEEPRGISARNVLPATIAEATADEGAVLLRLSLAGAELVARVVPSAARALALEPGRKVFAVVKTSSFRPLAV